MEAAGIAGSYGERAELALDAGCDMVLVCNHPDGVAEVIDTLEGYTNPVGQMRLMRMHGKEKFDREELLDSHQWKAASEMIAGLDASPWLELDV
jgi:beta-N-acetylhexosaminidase